MVEKPEHLRIAIIMAGGTGERFWPFSRQNHPKQLLKLVGESQTLLEEAIDRLSPLIDPAHIFIATARNLQVPIQKARIGIPDKNILGEPCKRNTSGCLAYATAHLLARYSGDGSNLTAAVITADHLIGDPDLFCRVAEAALDTVERTNALGTIGIVPTRPETGYGYIEFADISQPISGSTKEIPFYRVLRFHEKPNRETAQRYIAGGRFLWNSGMFFWRVSTFLAGLRKAAPTMLEAISGMKKAILAEDERKVETIFQSLENISIDYALLEKTQDVIVTRGEFPWDDIGAWDTLARTRSRDADGNVTIGDPVVIDSRNCIVVNEPGADKIAVSVLGMDNLVVVVSKDAILVTPKDRAQDVRQVVEELKRRSAKQI
ncbi:MAG: sugar phosphate nucleotidyltransferase [bacterium]